MRKERKRDPDSHAVRQSGLRRRAAGEKRNMLTAVVLAAAVLLLAAIFLYACGGDEDEEETPPSEPQQITSEDSYGVFLGVDAPSFRISGFEGYDLVVVDAQELRSEQLRQLHSSGHKVYSYLNVGSLEKSREYYDEYRDLTLDKYENWPDERWVDVTSPKWQSFVTQELVHRILEKDPDIDGLFLDNLDIYSHMAERYEKSGNDSGTGEVFDALVHILEAYHREDLPVLINGADLFVSGLISEGKEELVRGVNQENVFSLILDYDRDRFGEQEESESRVYRKYLQRCKKAGLDVFLLEYTKDSGLIEDILDYCEKNDFRFYISEHVDLSFADGD